MKKRKKEKMIFVDDTPSPDIRPLHVHAYRKKIVPATCAELGYTLHVCECGDEYRDSFTPLVAHVFQEQPEIPATCTEAGRRDFVCSVCGGIKTETIPATGHSFSDWIEQKKAGCVKNGFRARRCSECGKTETEKIRATGHLFTAWAPSNTHPGKEERFCQRCGKRLIRKKKES